MIMTKVFFVHDLTPILGYCPRETFQSKKLYTFRKLIFSLFTAFKIFFYLVFLIFFTDYPRFSIIFNIHYKAQIKSFLIIITVLLNA